MRVRFSSPAPIAPSNAPERSDPVRGVVGSAVALLEDFERADVRWTDPVRTARRGDVLHEPVVLLDEPREPLGGLVARELQERRMPLDHSVEGDHRCVPSIAKDWMSIAEDPPRRNCSLAFWQAEL